MAKENRAFNTICCRAGFRLGKLAGRKGVPAQEHAGHGAVRVALCVSLFVLCIFLISTVVFTVHSLLLFC